ncbi:ExbD/TolR family protein [Gloeobacter kilaueensis]|uniref:Biopolymer transport protein ExbD/TolR n=1 Tax=Gloeobacter kilaueensis (strain ATCC BAA-2537 / CCAP 1431/1 / ULC 316 / JS1) TaxID=1183438 RepID=U5QIZ1_GLOK1|nr:biopolymer transporter ExbD [Gloeobacter kilaueensis]AGY58947.1 biopolymer transport protein ExbD/TolR [Gloeobacter kilaueensis JS1]
MSVKFSGSEDDGSVAGEINVVPLIDVLFAILTFFVLASIFLTRQQGLNMPLPKATAAITNQFNEQVTLSVTRDGKFFLNKDPIDKKSIGPAIKAILDKDPNRLVVIAGDKRVHYRFVVDILDELRQVNATRIAMATDVK